MTKWLNSDNKGPSVVLSPNPDEPGASLVAPLVENPPAMQETPVSFLGWEDLLEKG